MGRNDQILLFSLGGTAGLIILVLVIATDASSTTAPEWAQSILTAIAVVVAITIPLRTESRHQEIRERTAEVIVASALRSWLRIAAEEVDDNLSFQGTGGQEGQRKIDMPPLGLSTDQIASMRPHYAREVLSLVERRERRQSGIYREQFRGDDDDGLMEYYEQIAHLFWSVRRVYQEIARDRELDEFTNRPSELDSIGHVAEKAKEYREQDRGDI